MSRTLSTAMAAKRYAAAHNRFERFRRKQIKNLQLPDDTETWNRLWEAKWDAGEKLKEAALRQYVKR